MGLLELHRRKRSERVIEQLRRKYPSGQWMYDQHLYHWRNDELHMQVHGVSHTISTETGPSEDEHYVTYADQDFNHVDIPGAVHKLY
jgi:hypothetical protein